jgi:hypothetical protein
MSRGQGAARVVGLLVVGDVLAGMRLGAMIRPSGNKSPVSSKVTTPLHSRDQPCSGWLATTRAASRSGASAVGHEG